MSCDEVNPFIEAVAVGEAVPDPIRAHVGDCARCAARLALARRIDAVLAGRPVPAIPAGFTASVMVRLRRERWRTEQFIDMGFNVAMALGALFIVAGIGGFAWRTGVLQVGGDMATVLFAVSRTAAARAVADARVILIGVVLLSTAFGLWWWAEEEDAAV